jgi:YgiT-type zinc finger domain-containing protein
MKYAICRHGETRPGNTIVTLQRGDTTVVIKGVPADVCDNCGEYYLTADMSARVLALAEEAVRHGAEVEVLRFAA